MGSFLQGTGGEVRRVQTVKGWEKSRLVTSQVAHTHWLPRTGSCCLKLRTSPQLPAGWRCPFGQYTHVMSVQ